MNIARSTHLGLLAGLLCLAAGCWSAGYASDDGYAPPDKPRPGPDVTPPGPVAGPLPQPAEVEEFDDEDFHLAILPGPVAINIRKGAPRSRLLTNRAVVRIDLPAGFDQQPTGLAELAAMAVSQTPDGASSRPSLQYEIQQLGGELDVEVGAAWTRFTATVPRVSWVEALTMMARRMHRQPVTQTAFADLQHHLIQKHRDRWRSNPLLSQASQWLRHGELSRSEIIEAIEDRSLPEVTLYQRRNYQPQHVAIGLWVPGAPEDPTYLLERAKSAVLAWVREPMPPKVGAEGEPEATAGPRGIQWIEGPGTSRVALLLPVGPATPEWLTLLEALTMGGIGGRLGNQLERDLGHEPVFLVHQSGNYDARYLVLETEVLAREVPQLVEIARAAWQTLARTPPVGKELATAIRRAQLRLLGRQDSPNAWFEAAGLRLIRRQEGGPGKDLATLAKMNARGFGAVLEDWAEREVAMVVSGGTPPENLGVAFTKVTAEVPEYHRATHVDEQASEEKAQPYMKLAIEALGDPGLFTTFRGYELREEWRGANRLRLEVDTTFRSPDVVDRYIKVLGLTIESVVKNDLGKELVGEQTREMSVAEATNLCNEAGRHPIALLASHAQKRSRFRLIGLRTRSGRRVALLERIDETRPRLRMTVDVRSGLLRSVETTLRRPEVGVVEVRDYYDDYRSQEGLRIPWHRVTTVDNSREGVDCIVRSFRLIRQ